MSYTDWYNGTKRCTITADQIKPRNMQNNVAMVAQVMQGAFNVYYQGFQASKAISEVTYHRNYSQAAKDKINAMRYAMEADLKSSCDQWGWNDLYWCFKHIYENNGSYRDDSSNGWKGICNIPLGVSNFLEIIETKGGKFADSVADFNRAQADAKRLAEAGKWDKVGEQLSSIKGTLETYGPYLWVCIPGNPGKAPRNVELIAKCFDYAGQIHGTLSKGLKAEQIMNSANFKRDLFVETMASVVGRLPIMGPLYAEVIRGVPASIDYFKKIARERNAMFNETLR